MQYWLKNDLEASWEKVVRCLEVAGKKKLAAYLRRKTLLISAELLAIIDTVVLCLHTFIV